MEDLNWLLPRLKLFLGLSLAGIATAAAAAGGAVVYAGFRLQQARHRRAL